MDGLNPKVLQWARQTAGFSLEEAAKKLGIGSARGQAGAHRLALIESGENTPSRAQLLRMAKQYRRSLLTLYLPEPPPKGDRGQDFRSLRGERSLVQDALLDALLRDIRSRQAVIRSVLEDDDDTHPLPFIGAQRVDSGVSAVVSSLQEVIGLTAEEFSAQHTVENAFALLRQKAESVGIFVLLIGNLGSHHSNLELETFRGFALADPLAPFIVLNDQDARSAWSFTLVHELAHLWIGETGVSNQGSETKVEKFCNDVAGEFLFPSALAAEVGVSLQTSVPDAYTKISEFAQTRNLGRSFVAYKLLRLNLLDKPTWSQLSQTFLDEWRSDRADRKEKAKAKDSGPNYYVVRRHRLGVALLNTVSRMLADGSLTPGKAGRVLGVKPRSVEPLLSTTVSALQG